MKNLLLELIMLRLHEGNLSAGKLSVRRWPSRWGAHWRRKGTARKAQLQGKRGGEEGEQDRERKGNKKGNRRQEEGKRREQEKKMQGYESKTGRKVTEKRNAGEDERELKRMKAKVKKSMDQDFGSRSVHVNKGYIKKVNSHRRWTLYTKSLRVTVTRQGYFATQLLCAAHDLFLSCYDSLLSFAGLQSLCPMTCCHVVDTPFIATTTQFLKK